jgi:hypothetical protein
VKYILSSDPDEPGIRYGRYLDYLQTIKNALPENIYAFASDEKYFMLNSPHSLHDAWLNSLEIRETRDKERVLEPIVGLTVKLLGQTHDRVIILEYEDVSEYRLEGRRDVPDGPPDFRYGDTFHGDVFTHEIRLGKEGRIIHEIAFVTESSFLVECRKFSHREEMLSTT